MKNGTWKLVVIGVAMAAIVVVIFQLFANAWNGHVKTGSGMVTDLEEKLSCVQGAGCSTVRYIEIDGERYHYLETLDVPFAEIAMGDRVRFSARGFRVPLPYVNRMVEPEIFELEKLE